MDFKSIAKEILVNVGNEENIKDVIHCHRRSYNSSRKYGPVTSGNR